MEIKADKEAKEAITQLCDIALKTAGLANYMAVGNILTAMNRPETNPQKVTPPASVAKKMKKTVKKGRKR